MTKECNCFIAQTTTRLFYASQIDQELAQEFLTMAGDTVSDNHVAGLALTLLELKVTGSGSSFCD